MAIPSLTSEQTARAALALTAETTRRGTKRAAQLAGCTWFDSIPPGLEKVGRLVSSFRLPVVFRLGDASAFELVRCNPDAVRIIKVIVLRDGSEEPQVLKSNPEEPTVPTLELYEREERVETAYPVVQSSQRTSEDTLLAVSDAAHQILSEQLPSLRSTERSAAAAEAAEAPLVTVWVPVEETVAYCERTSPPRPRLSVEDMLAPDPGSPI